MANDSKSIREKISQRASQLKDSAVDKAKDSAKESIDAKLEENRVVGTAKKAANLARRAAVLGAHLVKGTVSAMSGLVAVLVNPITWVLLLCFFVMILTVGTTRALGQNTFSEACGVTTGAPQFSTATTPNRIDRGKKIMGHFLNVGFTEEQASRLSASILAISDGDAAFNVPNSCNNDCAINDSTVKDVGLISFSREQVVALAEFAKENSADWRDASTQLRFISEMLENLSEDDKDAFKDNPGISLISTTDEDVHSPIDEETLRKEYKGEAEECKAMGDGSGDNQWAITKKRRQGSGIGTGIFVSPVGADARCTSAFGSRTHPVTGEKNTFHRGLDFGQTSDNVIYAADGGVVIQSCDSCNHWTYGQIIMIDHGSGYVTLYAHLSKRTVQVGDKVSAGDPIAIMGNTGRGTGTHLHFEIMKDGQLEDPEMHLGTLGCGI